jgi:N-acyl homoserine lactone hydrolase
MYRLDVLVQGYPGKSVCHGGLGWSTIALLRGEGRVILIDVGAFGVRKELEKQLAARGVSADAVTDVVLTHAHYDHSVNYTLFPSATVWIGRTELEWARDVPPGFNPLPELYVQDMAHSPRVRLIEDGAQFLPGLTAIAAQATPRAACCSGWRRASRRSSSPATRRRTGQSCCRSAPT